MKLVTRLHSTLFHTWPGYVETNCTMAFVYSYTVTSNCNGIVTFIGSGLKEVITFISNGITVALLLNKSNVATI
jgi:hypothetical protein